MITQNDVVAAVKAAILETYPGETVYVNLVPSRFVRPSFLVETTDFSVTASTCGSVTLRSTVHVVCFENVDEYHNSQLESLNVRQMAVIGLFAPMFLPGGDRAPDVVKLSGSAGGRDWTDVTAVLEWDEDLNEFRSIRELPNMEDITLRLEETTNGNAKH